MGKVKVSVFIPADLHRRLKLAAFERGNSLQQVVEEALIDRDDAEDLEPARSNLSPREVRQWQKKLKHILESGNGEVVQNVGSTIAAISKLNDLRLQVFPGGADRSASRTIPRAEERQLRIVRPIGRAIEQTVVPDDPSVDLSPFGLRLEPVTKEFDRIIADLSANPADIHKLKPRRFEELIAEMWKRMGYAVELTPETRDGGRDVIATRYAETRSQVLIECKKFSPGRTVGIDVVQRLLGALYQYNATQGVLTTTSTLTRDALRVVEAKPNHLTAHEYKDVIGLLWRVRMIVVPATELWLPTSTP